MQFLWFYQSKKLLYWISLVRAHMSISTSFDSLLDMIRFIGDKHVPLRCCFNQKDELATLQCVTKVKRTIIKKKKHFIIIIEWTRVDMTKWLPSKTAAYSVKSAVYNNHNDLFFHNDSLEFYVSIIPQFYAFIAVQS